MKASEPLVLESSVVLIGLMGAGKSKVGRGLAERLKVAFTDSDEAIEAMAGMTIAEIFEQDGEEAFRALEVKVLSDLFATTRGVIATGGGAFMDSHVRSCIKEGAVSVWLKAKPETLASRISDVNKRPLLKGKDVVQELTRLAKERYPVYAEASLTVDTDGLELAEAIDKTYNALTYHLDNTDA